MRHTHTMKLIGSLSNHFAEAMFRAICTGDRPTTRGNEYTMDAYYHSFRIMTRRASIPITEYHDALRAVTPYESTK